MLSAAQVAKLQNALPFWMSILLIPLIWVSATQGGWWVLLLPLTTWYLFSGLDFVTGLNEQNADPEIGDEHLRWYTLITLIWAPVQFVTLFALIWYAARADHLNGWEIFGLAFGMGVISGTIGINYSHELMHQKNRVERWMGDILLAMVLYSHFRSEHLLVHHRYVATPKDPVTARYGEGFFRFFPRVLVECGASAFTAERAMLARKGKPWWDRSNPFWRYWALQAGMLVLAALLGGWIGLWMFVTQAIVAIWQLELVNYVEHYGLTRRHLGEGKYEHVKPHHSWNAAHRASNWLLINLQRHSDHHYKPDRRFPLLQTYGTDEAPQLPYGYPVMTIAAMFPSLWRRVMNPRVKAWRARNYPDISDWSSYNSGTNPLPR
ncbi:alkane 1-monooxygenase [Pseudaestuariivita atlantica]|uniref:Alkane 1-monooxygenase n=1 Tax=Pseudaestuariivita atlantica TaxID=1317121 RepID=A0A0L1JP96_9RHOB|nr:alkane 1-monooxygenase [Pseudaestuariivita atlantica]KNG93584.1 alkane 1-monooxygenase [Pseudaestuariivita atlantica]